MMKVANENANHVLNILYANNHFELAIRCDPMINSSNIHTCDAYDTKNLNHDLIMKLMKFNINKKCLIGILN
jgi:hypothetical protein